MFLSLKSDFACPSNFDCSGDARNHMSNMQQTRLGHYHVVASRQKSSSYEDCRSEVVTSVHSSLMTSRTQRDGHEATRDAIMTSVPNPPQKETIFSHLRWRLASESIVPKLCQLYLEPIENPRLPRKGQIKSCFFQAQFGRFLNFCCFFFNWGRTSAVASTQN